MDSLINYYTYKDVISALKSSYKKEISNEFYQYSKLWKSILLYRDSLHDFSDLFIALNDRFTFINGVAEVVPDSKKNSFIEYYKTFLNKQFLIDYPLSWIGAPSLLDFEGLPANAAYLSNLRLFAEVLGFLKKHLPADHKPLHIVEIGAGYGGLAYFLIKSGIAASYTIIDLPQNLELNSFYLTQNFQTLRWQVLSSDSSIKQVEAGVMNFLTPGNIHSIEQCRFDLAINSDSLGEMPVSTTHAYIKWIYEHLNEGGHFFSKNGHSRGVDSVQLPSNYGYDLFNLVEIKPPTAVSNLFDDFSHYIFLSKPEEASHKPMIYPPFFLDALCGLYKLGLHEELADLSASYSNNCLNDIQINFLNVCNQYLSTKSLQEKINLLNNATSTGIYENCFRYLKGLALYLMNHTTEAVKILTEFDQESKSHIAEAYAKMVRAKHDRSILTSNFRCGAKTNYVLTEIRNFYKFKQPFRYLALKLRKDALMKKINHPQHYSPSNLLKLKNIIFNIREGKKWGIART